MPNVDAARCVRRLARVLYPEAFPENLRPIVRDFYSRFYHQAPTAAQLEQLLNTAP